MGKLKEKRGTATGTKRSVLVYTYTWNYVRYKNQGSEAFLVKDGLLQGGFQDYNNHERHN